MKLTSIHVSQDLNVVGLHPVFTAPRKGRRFDETQIALPLAA